MRPVAPTNDHNSSDYILQLPKPDEHFPSFIQERLTHICLRRKTSQLHERKSTTTLLAHTVLHFFKICTITYQVLSSKQPAYLYTAHPARQPSQLRSYNSTFVPNIKTNVGTRAFSVAASTLWSVKSVGNNNISPYTKNPPF